MIKDMQFFKAKVGKRFIGIALLVAGLLAVTAGALKILTYADQQPALKEVVVQGRESSNKKGASVRFAAVGDFGATDDAKAVLTTMGKEKPDYTLALGDLSYSETTEKEWCALVHSSLGDDHPFEIVAGNHDTDGMAIGSGKGHIYDFAACLPNRMSSLRGDYALNYYFDYQNLVRSIMISPDISLAGHEFSFQKGGADFEWLKNVLTDARSKSIPWVVVGMHKNCITMGEKTCEIGTDVLDLLAEQKVDLVLQGHEHAYFRSKQLVINEQCPSLLPAAFKAACVVEGTDNKQYKKGEGTILAIPGTGGRALRDVNQTRPEKDYFAVWSGKNVDPTYGPLIVDLNKNTLSAYFSGTDGKKHDVFSVQQ